MPQNCGCRLSLGDRRQSLGQVYEERFKKPYGFWHSYAPKAIYLKEVFEDNSGY